MQKKAHYHVYADHDNQCGTILYVYLFFFI